MSRRLRIVAVDIATNRRFEVADAASLRSLLARLCHERGSAVDVKVVGEWRDMNNCKIVNMGGERGPLESANGEFGRSA